MYWIGRGKIFEWMTPNAWWHSHAMAPSAIYAGEGRIRIFIGCWDSSGISRIGYVDVDADNPKKIVGICQKPVLEIGREGMFDENGVFPAHASIVNGRVFLYYTGFQLGHKIRHYNFGGLAISDDAGETFSRVSEAPVLDRADEGLCVRAGQSVLLENGHFRTVYSAGTGWHDVGGKPRPTYDVYYQDSPDGITYSKTGKLILRHDPEKEHGLGRPQIVKIDREYFIFYTRRTLDMKYFLGCARSQDCAVWERSDNLIQMEHPKSGFDSEMIYFPSVVNVSEKDKWLMFYCGNDFGKTGIGYAELIR